MNLTIDVQEDSATVLRDDVLIGTLKLDDLGQVDEVVIEATATPEEDEEIVRLAGSHVAQYVRHRKATSMGGLIKETYRDDSLHISHSRELLDFRAIPRAARERMSVAETEEAMRMLGVKVVRIGPDEPA